MKKKGNFIVLKKPVISEKSLKLVEEKNQYIFDVDRRADKKSVKKAVEEKFKVKVVKVHFSFFLLRKSLH
jgi:large subunit ribosomal protein L23